MPPRSPCELICGFVLLATPGMEPIGGAWIQFNIRYYMFALVFVIFDVETVFLYPWAVAFHRLGILAFIEALVFIAILVVALAYAWRKGALEWS